MTLSKAELCVWYVRGSHSQSLGTRAAQPLSSGLLWVSPAARRGFWSSYTILTAWLPLSCQMSSQFGCSENTPNLHCRLTYERCGKMVIFCETKLFSRKLFSHKSHTTTQQKISQTPLVLVLNSFLVLLLQR